jgi:hypothetical protein
VIVAVTARFSFCRDEEAPAAVMASIRPSPHRRAGQSRDGKQIGVTQG